MLAAGQAAPEFVLKDTAGQETTLQELTGSGPAVLAFFKTGCPVCQFTAPFLERLAASENMRLVGISQDDSPTTKGFMHRFGMTFPVLLDELRAEYPASNGFGISTVPSVFVVEQNGTVSAAFSGFSKRDLESLGQRAGIPVFKPGENVPDFKAG